MTETDMANINELSFSVPEGGLKVAPLHFGDVLESQAPDICQRYDKFWENENAYTFSMTINTGSIVSAVKQIEELWERSLDASMNFKIGRRKPITTRIIGYTVSKDPDAPDDTSVGRFRIFVELDAQLLKQDDIQIGPQIPV